MLEAQSLRTEAGVKSKKRSRSMFAGLKGFASECILLSNRNGKNEPKCQRKYLRSVKRYEKSLVQRCYQSSRIKIFEQTNRDI